LFLKFLLGSEFTRGGLLKLLRKICLISSAK
jgi:hypothetical protein